MDRFPSDTPLLPACVEALVRLDARVVSPYDARRTRAQWALANNLSFFDPAACTRWSGTDPRGRLREFPAPMAFFTRHVGWPRLCEHPLLGTIEFGTARENYDLGDRILAVIALTASQRYVLMDLLDTSEDPRIWSSDHGEIEPTHQGSLSGFLSALTPGAANPRFREWSFDPRWRARPGRISIFVDVPVAQGALGDLDHAFATTGTSSGADIAVCLAKMRFSASYADAVRERTQAMSIGGTHLVFGLFESTYDAPAGPLPEGGIHLGDFAYDPAAPSWTVSTP